MLQFPLSFSLIGTNPHTRVSVAISDLQILEEKPKISVEEIATAVATMSTYGCCRGIDSFLSCVESIQAINYQFPCAGSVFWQAQWKHAHGSRDKLSKKRKTSKLGDMIQISTHVHP